MSDVSATSLPAVYTIAKPIAIVTICVNPENGTYFAFLKDDPSCCQSAYSEGEAVLELLRFMETKK